VVKGRRPWITTLVLLGILAALAAYIFLVEARREPPPEEEALPTPAPLWEFEGGDVMGITVTKGERTTAVVRDGSAWRMTRPEEGEADSGRLDGLVHQVAGIKFTRAMDGVGDGSVGSTGGLAAFGLQEPEVRATLVLNGGTTINVGIGTENPRHTARYVQKEGDPLVYLVPIGDVDGLIKLVDEPPYPPTSAPPPSPAETPAVEPSPTLTETPAPTATPQPRPTLTPAETPTPTATPKSRPTPTPAS